MCFLQIQGPLNARLMQPSGGSTKQLTASLAKLVEILHLVKYKCMPILLYGVEVLNLNKSQLSSLDFVANRFMMKLFNTNNMQIIEFCCEQFNFILSSRQIANRRDKVINKFIKSDSQRTNLLTFVNMQILLLRSLYMSCLDKYMPFICMFFLLSSFSFLS